MLMLVRVLTNELSRVGLEMLQVLVSVNVLMDRRWWLWLTDLQLLVLLLQLLGEERLLVGLLEDRVQRRTVLGGRWLVLGECDGRFFTTYQSFLASSCG